MRSWRKDHDYYCCPFIKVSGYGTNPSKEIVHTEDNMFNMSSQPLKEVVPPLFHHGLDEGRNSGQKNSG